MSKKLIAGAGVVASFAIALAPLATFADSTINNFTSDEHNDELNITINPACAFGNVVDGTVTKGIAHTAGASVPTMDDAAGAWTPNGDTNSNGLGRVPDKSSGTYGTSNANISTDSFAYTVYAGTTRDDMATTALTIFCNSSKGYTLNAETEDLLEWNSTSGAAVSGGEKIEANTTFDASTTGYGIVSVNVGASGATTSYASTRFANSAQGGGEIAYKATSADVDNGDTITMTYGLGVSSGQKAGLYKGKVIYTLFQGVNDHTSEP